MLKKVKEYSKIVLVGSTSEIGLAIVNKIPIASKGEIIFIGRTQPELPVFLNENYINNFIYCDFLESKSVIEAEAKLKEISKIDLLILAAGYLPPENSEFNTDLIRQTMIVNTLTPAIFISAIAEQMSKYGEGDILLISSVAVTRARKRNFTYGSSKAGIDFFATGLAHKLRKTGVFVSILRPGFVYTKMTKNFKPAPFSTNLEIVGNIAVNGLINRKEIIYAPKKLKYIMKIIKKLPNTLFKRIE
jgi:decaprenylphospho-beta-D-erythro-pentofuranosid-2-ulose 2-reductase